MEIIFEDSNIFKNIKCPYCGIRVNLSPDDVELKDTSITDPYGELYNFSSDYLSYFDADKLLSMIESFDGCSDKAKKEFVSDIKKIKKTVYNVCVQTDPNAQDFKRIEYAYTCPVCKKKNFFHTTTKYWMIVLECFDDEKNAITYKKDYDSYTQFFSIDKNNAELINVITKIGYVFVSNGTML